jgi:hypothetical protein
VTTLSTTFPALHTHFPRTASSLTPLPPTGLFVRDAVAKGGFICNYGGELIHSQDAQFGNPMYLVAFDFGKRETLICFAFSFVSLSV